jgi:hypothetical protein
MKRQKKRYGGPSTLRSKGFLVPKRFSEEDDEIEDVVGQPNDKEGK